MSFIDEVKKYKETKALEKKKECIEMIKKKIFLSIDEDPLNKLIILLYDEDFKIEMHNYVEEYLSRKGFIVCECRKSKYCQRTGMDPGYPVGMVLLSKGEEIPYSNVIRI